MEKSADRDCTLEAFKALVPYLRGALWWVRNDLLKKRQRTFNQKDEHKGHPALSVRNSPIGGRHEAVPMLMGTSGHSLRPEVRSDCVTVVGMTKGDPKHITYFGSIVEPGLYRVEELLEGVAKKPGIEEASNAKVGKDWSLIRKAWYEIRSMCPNWDKPMVSAEERTQLNNFCMRHGL